MMTSRYKIVRSPVISRVVFLLVVSCFYSCEDFVTIDPGKTLTTNTVFANDETATAAMTGIYSKMMSANASFANTQITLLAGLSADELTNYTTFAGQREFYENALTTSNTNIIILWRDTYEYIYQTNAIIEALSRSTGMTDPVKKQVEGEAKFFRAFCYFYLVNLFSDVPYVTTTDYRVSSQASRTPAQQVYQQIIADLKDSQNLLGDAYVTTGRVRPNRWAATALLARTYLYTKDSVNAEIQATDVINNTNTYSLVSDLNKVFLENSKEAVWQLMPVVAGINTQEGNLFILNTAPNSIALSEPLFNAFETGDNRKTAWTGSITVDGQTYYYPYKYKVKTSAGTGVTEYTMMFRLAEQYLIRAEARAQQEDISGAVADLNVIRQRAGLGDLSTSLTKAQCLAAVEQERRSELFVEMGHRWLDLKRTGRADAVLAPVKPNWQSTDVLYPILRSEIQNNRNLTQNPGYDGH